MLVPRRIMALMIVGFYGHMAVYPQGYTSGTYSVLADVVPLRVWALVMCMAGVAMLCTRALWSTALVGGVLCAWVGGLLAATFTGQSQSPAGAWWIGGYVALLFWGAGRDQRV